MKIRNGLSGKGTDMLKRLLLKDFQCYERLLVDFDPLITTFVGPSDVGKSAVLRGLRWLACNRPLGDGQRRHGADRAFAKGEIGDHTVVRAKGKGGNYYKVDGNKLEAFGSAVPEQVETAFNLDKANFQGQHEPPFWFNLTSGELASELNRIVDLEVIDTASAKVSSILRKARAEVEVTEERLEKVKEDENKLSWVPEMDFRLQRLERLEEEIEERKERLETLGQMLQSIRRQQRRVADMRRRIDTWNTVSERLERGSDVMEKRMNKIDSLTKLLRQIREASRKLDLTKERTEQSRKRLEKETGGVCPVCGGPLKGVSSEQ